MIFLLHWNDFLLTFHDTLVMHGCEVSWRSIALLEVPVPSKDASVVISIGVCGGTAVARSEAAADSCEAG